MRLSQHLALTAFAASLIATPQTPAPAPAHNTPGQKMAATVIALWPAGSSSLDVPGKWAYEEGVLLDGIAAEWHANATPGDFAYIKASVDKYVNDDGSIRGFNDRHTLDDIEMGRADLLVYRVTQQAKYAKAAQFLHDRLAAQPRNASGGYWHKQVYPNQMWLDGAYMAEPFRAAYAATFQQNADWNDIAQQLLLMDAHMRDAKTGLLRHGWDESKAMPWAEKTTGLSPEVWARAMGWYAMALVDVLDWFPDDIQHHPQHAALVSALQRNMAAVVKAQDPASGLWWQVMTHPGGKGNYFEASGSCMFTYALAKSVRQGYLPVADEAAARKAWNAIDAKFITTDADGMETLRGTVRVGGLGGKPYRSGDYAYYLSEKVVDNDSKGLGAYMLAASEMEQASTATLARGKTVLMDAWFNSQTRQTALGQTELFHYKWDDDSNSGYSFFGRAFRRYGAKLATLPSAPTAANLSRAQVYIIASPDNPSKNTAPHYMDTASAAAIMAWVRNGGTLLLFSNDRDNTEFEHFNILADRLGVHFNPVLSHHVVDPDHSTGEVAIPPGAGIFGDGFTAYMKDTSTIAVSKSAKALVTDRGDVMIAEARIGKGRVLAVVDPWFYNEYADGRKMGQYRGFEAAVDVAAWALKIADWEAQTSFREIPSLKSSSAVVNHSTPQSSKSLSLDHKGNWR